jgi:hypothetical protein
MMHHSAVFKPLSTIILLSWALYITVNIITSFQKEPISTGGSKIVQDPWALAALFDYVASLGLGVAFVVARSTVKVTKSVHQQGDAGLNVNVVVEEGWQALLKGFGVALAVTFLGNPVLLMLVAYWIYFGVPHAKTLREAWLVGVPASTEFDRKEGKGQVGLWVCR